MHPDPIAVHVEKWGEIDEYDPSGVVPIWVCRVEMPDAAAMGKIRGLFRDRVDAKKIMNVTAAEEQNDVADAGAEAKEATSSLGDSGSSSGEESPHLCTRSIVERLNAQQAQRRKKLDRLETVVRVFNAKVCVCEETARQSAAVCSLRAEHVKLRVEVDENELVFDPETRSN